jgi:hypothetical protein
MFRRHLQLPFCPVLCVALYASKVACGITSLAIFPTPTPVWTSPTKLDIIGSLGHSWLLTGPSGHIGGSRIRVE